MANSLFQRAGRNEIEGAKLNLSAQAELAFARLLDEQESQSWVQRNAETLLAHGCSIAATGLAGEEFDRI